MKWEAIEWRCHAKTTVVVEDETTVTGKRVICDVETTEEDARLIAAAPDLLEALQFVLSAHGEQLSTAFEMADAAIAKATGGAA